MIYFAHRMLLFDLYTYICAELRRKLPQRNAALLVVVVTALLHSCFRCALKATVLCVNLHLRKKISYGLQSKFWKEIPIKKT